MEDRHPTVTAAVVAATLLLQEDELVDRPRVEAAVREALPELGLLLDRVPWPVLSRLARGVERVASPGFSLHYLQRKRAVRAGVEAALASGHDQVVLLGAGFDMMSHALVDRAHVFEVDHPRSQAVKRRAIDDARVTYVPVDLVAGGLAEALLASGLDPRRDTVVAAEGLFMYFDRALVLRLLDELATVLRGRRRLVATFLTPDEHGKVRLHSQRRVVDLVMELLGETFAFGAPIPELVDVLVKQGWPVTDIVTTQLPGKPAGEVIVTAAGGHVFANVSGEAAAVEMR